MRFTAVALLFASAAMGKELATSLWDWYVRFKSNYIGVTNFP